jgi:Mlc titration factor MtfA (ptsG expression regulator)
MIVGIIVSGAVVLVLAMFAAFKIKRDIRRRRLFNTPLPHEWEEIIKKNVKLYNRLPDELKNQLHGLVNIFVAEKNFEGCGGLEITEQIKVTIAAQACILLLNRKTNCFSKLKTILVYPHTYVAKRFSSGGVIEVQGRSVRLGESWQNGPVVLAWDSVIGGAVNITDGKNVVLHEFSHQLDQEDGIADGAPILASRSSYATWAQVLGAEYENLQKKAKRFRKSVIHRYGATNPPEFFAVATETFFEKPGQLKKKHPELYDALSDYYKMDPAAWG